MLLGLAHCLQSGPVVTAASIRRALDCLPPADREIERHLTRFGVELEATSSPRGELSFDLAYRELAAVALHAEELDPSTLGIKPIVYDTSKPM
jgi:hypothetical protein